MAALLGMGVEALSEDGKCRILSLRGGGVHGSFEVGVLKAMVERLGDTNEMHYDYVGGVSVGALNTAMFSLFDKGEEREAVEFMEGNYRGKGSDQLFKIKDYAFFKAFTTDSIADNTPIREMLETVLEGKDFKRKLSVLSVDLKQGYVVIFDETMRPEERVDAFLSSTSITMAFPAVDMQVQEEPVLLVDGSLYATITFSELIERCREEVADDSDIIVDLIMCYSNVYAVDEWSLDQTRWASAYEFYKRRKDITEYYLYLEDVIRLTRGYKDVSFRYLVAPS